MQPRLKVLISCSMAFILFACEPSSDDNTEIENKSSQETSQSAKEDSFKTIEWTDLIPQDDLNAILDQPTYLRDIEEGSFEDKITNKVQNAIEDANNDRYQEALSSTRVISEMDGESIRIPGFIVPLEYSDEKTVTQFFLVPFFGACIHVPPPPPNQIIFVEYPKGLELSGLYQPYWLSGTLKISLFENDVATSAYTLELQHYEEFSD